MGLNFRKSINLLPGVKLNLSKSGVSLSGGVKGFRKSINTKGQVTTTASIPGTGIYYTDKKKIGASKAKKEKEAKKETTKKADREKTKGAAEQQPVVEQPAAPQIEQPAPRFVPASQQQSAAKQIDAEALKAICKTADDTIDWDEILASSSAPDGSYNQEMWAYYHSMAPHIMQGDIDAYLQLIYEVNPLNDLLEYSKNFEFGTDTPAKMEVEYVVNPAVLADAKKNLMLSKYNDLLQDFICSVCIRVARDMFALLPVEHTVVHAVLGDITVLSVDFDRQTLAGVKFGFIDPSEVMSKFTHNMKFSANLGFYPVERVIVR